MHLPISVHELASATRTGSSDPKNQRPIADLGKRPTALDVLLDKSRPIQPHPIQRCRLADATWREPHRSIAMRGQDYAHHPDWPKNQERLIEMKSIFEVRMKPGYMVDEYADAWVRASKIIQRTPGACGTYLHRKIGDPTTLLAIVSSIAMLVMASSCE